MIRYALVCNRKHDFEIWFQNSADYDKQAKRGLVICPVCDSKKVDKALMSPSLGRGSRKGKIAVTEEAPTPPAAEAPDASVAPAPMPVVSSQEIELRTKLKALRDHLLKNADNVGKNFPEEARKMHYGEIEHRSIYGEASPDDAKELLDEGIEFQPIPILPDDRN